MVRKYLEDPLQLAVEEMPEPTCPDDGFLVEVRAVGVNFFDILQSRGGLEQWRDCWRKWTSR